MNTLLLKKFTPEILRGAKSLGCKPDSSCSTLRVKQAEDIERKTGRSIGELAMLGIESDATAAQQKAQRELLRETMELMTDFDSHPPTRQKVGNHEPAAQH